MLHRSVKLSTIKLSAVQCWSLLSYVWWCSLPLSCWLMKPIWPLHTEQITQHRTNRNFSEHKTHIQKSAHRMSNITSHITVLTLNILCMIGLFSRCVYKISLKCHMLNICSCIWMCYSNYNKVWCFELKRIKVFIFKLLAYWLNFKAIETMGYR